MKLSVELVPATCWCSNVRSVVSRALWDRIRHRVYDQAWNVCQICGGVGPKHPVEAHEIWSYDDVNLIQKLEGMIALCPDCHSVKHFGFAQASGRGERAMKHLMKVNKLSRKKTERYLQDVFKQWFERSQKSWKLDISHLSGYDIDVSKIERK